MQLHKAVEPLLQVAQGRKTSACGQQQLRRQAQAAAHAILTMNRKTIEQLTPPQ